MSSATVAERPAVRPTARPTSVSPTSPAPPAARPAGAGRTRLLLEGPIVSTLLRLAAANVIVNLVLIAVTPSVDAHFVGRLSPSALAGLSLVFPLVMLMQQIANSSMGGAMASTIRVSASGAGAHPIVCIPGGGATTLAAGRDREPFHADPGRRLGGDPR